MAERLVDVRGMVLGAQSWNEEGDDWGYGQTTAVLLWTPVLRTAFKSAWGEWAAKFPFPREAFSRSHTDMTHRPAAPAEEGQPQEHEEHELSVVPAQLVVTPNERPPPANQLEPPAAGQIPAPEAAYQGESAATGADTAQGHLAAQAAVGAQGGTLPASLGVPATSILVVEGSVARSSSWDIVDQQGRGGNEELRRRLAGN